MKIINIQKNEQKQDREFQIVTGVAYKMEIYLDLVPSSSIADQCCEAGNPSVSLKNELIRIKLEGTLTN